MKVPLSDHFDGNRFFNPTLPKGFAPSRLDAIKMAREPHSQWPTWVENTGVHRLNEMRAADEIAAITFVNHATFLIETGGITILTDPIWSERASPFRGIGPKRVRAPGVAFEDIPRVDVILLSHNHYDHLDVATLRRLRKSFAPTVLAAAGDARILGPLGFKSMRELDWWDEIQFNHALKITFVPAQHFSARGLFDQRKRMPTQNGLRLHHLDRTNKARPKPGHPYEQRAIATAQSKTRWCPPQSDGKLVAEKQILSFKPAPRLEQVGYQHSERVQDCKHRSQ